MLRKFIFKDTETGAELVLPVTPQAYDIEHGRKVSSLTMHQVGDVNLPGPAALLDEEIECLLPAVARPSNQPGASLNPFVYLEQLEKWSDAGTVLRFIISDTPVNAAVLLGPIRYREQDGTNDIYCTIPVRGYRQLAAETVESAATGNGARAVETQPEHGSSYTVQAGDTLSGICRKVYGDASLYGRLAAANGIANPNLIQAGQALKLPDVESLPAARAKTAGGSGGKTAQAVEPPSQQIAEATAATWDDVIRGYNIQLPQERARQILREGGLIGLGS